MKDQRATQLGNARVVQSAGFQFFLVICAHNDAPYSQGMALSAGAGGQDKRVGVFVSKVKPGSISDVAGLQLHQRVFEVDGTDVTNATKNQVSNALKAAIKNDATPAVILKVRSCIQMLPKGIVTLDGTDSKGASVTPSLVTSLTDVAVCWVDD